MVIVFEDVGLVRKEIRREKYEERERGAIEGKKERGGNVYLDALYKFPFIKGPNRKLQSFL